MKVRNTFLRKTVGMIMAGTLIAGCLFGCSKSENGETTAAKTEETTQMEEGTEEEVSTAEETTEEAAKEPEAVETVKVEKTDNGEMREELTAIELTKLMGNGTNLGNTMEAYGHSDPGIGKDVTVYETLWGQPVTTPEMMKGMKESGFDSIRIPIAWTNAMDFESGDYTIGEDYLNRIEELVDYARSCDMYVVINDHWDGSWWGMFGSSKEEDREAAMDMYVSMWTQIGERFKDYSDYVIFESANEELGDRLNDIDICKDSGGLTEEECYEITNKINQKFVDTIRASGGNNEQRFLLIAGYNTDIDRTMDDRFVMPNDSAKDKLMLSVHYYTPWNYCGTDSVDRWGTVRDYEEQNTQLEKLTKFTDKGYGVIIGEYAVIVKEDGSVKGNTCDYLNNFLDNCDKYGYCPLLWDCSYFFIRNDLKFVDEGIEEVYASRSYSAQEALSDEEIKENAEKNMEEALAAAPETFETNVNIADLDGAVAWIMFASQDWAVSYSVGDVYNPDSKTDGLVVTDVQVTGEGTYTVSLDFTGTEAGFAVGTSFSALAISNGELLYPGYVMDIKEVLVNGEPYGLWAKPYTSSDDGKCTRVNLYNEWVSDLPSDARTTSGELSGAGATLLNNSELKSIETLSITFDYVPGK